MQKIAVMVTSPPQSNLTATAIDYVTSAIEAGINVIGVFFYQDGVLNASEHVSLPTDEYQSIAKWQQLHTDYQLPLYLCISAAQKRGLSDEISGGELEPLSANTNMKSCFTIAGLGELVTLTDAADKMVQL